MNKYKVSFSVEYCPNDEAVKISDLMSECDLGISRVTIMDTYSWTTTTEPTKSYVEKLKEALTKGIETRGGRVYNIKLLEKSKILK